MTEEVIARSKGSDGDWICEDEECGNLNFARRSSCNRCGKEKSDASSPSKKQIGIEIGKAAAEKSRGLFSADDWQCSKCGNVNWARRFQCNMCNAPKFGDVEERTGYGGGYNDRGVVEYVSREESDDEYDEFGRKRKKLRGSSEFEEGDDHRKKLKESSRERERSPEPPQPEPKPHKETEEEEGDDDDDDDEDEDLSKYDLMSWEKDDEDSANAKENSNSESVKSS